MKCDYCNRRFVDTQIGLAEKTFHEMLHEPEIVNK